jgi:hypothetical protein
MPNEEPEFWEPMVQEQVDDLMEILPKATDLNLMNIDITQGRVTQGRDIFWMWDTDGHRVTFEICRIEGYVGKLITNRADEPDPTRPDALFAGEFTMAEVIAGTATIGKKKKPEKKSEGEFGWQ